MGKNCEVCGKGTVSGFNVSHSNKKTKKQWKANIQKIRADFNGKTRKINVCAQCLKAGKVKKAL